MCALLPPPIVFDVSGVFRKPVKAQAFEYFLKLNNKTKGETPENDCRKIPANRFWCFGGLSEASETPDPPADSHFVLSLSLPKTPPMAKESANKEKK